ncbi:MAG: glycosyltransferase family 2 protein, partial [Planctomycetota bacterium]
MSRISVVVPVFNRKEMVREALASVVGQSRRPDEIWLVDDGSDDGSGKAAKEFQGVSLIAQPNQGISAARNAGILRARGDYIAFLDSDDLWERDKLLLQERFMDAHPEIPLCHTDELWLKDGRKFNPKDYHRKEGGFLFRRSLERCLISPSAVMIRRSLFPIVGLFDRSMTVCEDYDLWLRITARYPVGFIPQPLTIKRGGHENQLSRKFPVMDLFRIMALEKVARERILPARELRAAISMTLVKARIILGGYRKRGKTREISDLRRRLKRLLEDYRRGVLRQRIQDSRS